MAGPSVEIHPAAESEAFAARQWYAERSPYAASAFMRELDQAVARVLEAPERWPRHLHGTRRLAFRRFPFFLNYRARRSVIQLIAVALARRLPGYWRGR